MSNLFVNQTNFECGELLWEWSNAQTMYDRRYLQAGGRRRIGVIYAGAVLAVMLGWFAYSLVTMSGQSGFLNAVLFHLPALFTMLVSGVILVLSFTSSWGKFIRFAVRRGLTDNSRESRDLAMDVLRADINKAEENAVRIHQRYIVVINKGKKVVLDMVGLKRVVCTRGREILTLSFHGKDEFYNAFAEIPSNEFPAIKKLLGDLLVEQREGDGTRESAASANATSFVKKIPIMLFLLIFVGAGAAVVALHYTQFPDVPAELGYFFIAIPMILAVALFSEYAVIGKGVVPLLLGLLFTAIPIVASFAIASSMNVSLISLLPAFTVVHVVFILFLAVGPLAIFAGIKGIIESLKFGK